MNRRILRTALKLGALVTLALLFILILDSRVSVLPSRIHQYLPIYHPGLVVTDVTIATCSSINLFSSCRLDASLWHRIEKDLYLGKGWTSKAYLHVQRKKEEDLLPTDKIVVDLKMGRLDPGAGSDAKWESRPGGIWLLRSSHHTSDTLTALDVLFGADAVDPRPNWEIKDTPLLLDTVTEPRLTMRRGANKKIEQPIPRIRKGGKFKIMQASDLHLATGFGVCRDPSPELKDGNKCEADPRTLEFLGKLLDEEKPDLVVLSGDQVNGDTAPDAQTATYKFAELFIKRKIPYAAIFGNHDDEGNLDRKALMSLLQGLPYSLSKPGPEDVDGVGNYLLEIPGYSSPHSALSLYLLDTHKYSPDERQYPGYDWLKPSQINWFKTTAKRLKKAHQSYTHIHMNLAFIHIPLPEYRNVKNPYQGGWLEAPTAPRFNSGFKDALTEENVVLVSCGHDHANDYCMLEKNAKDLPALWMCYAGGAGFGGYGGYGNFVRRVRFFDIDMNEARIVSYKRLEHGNPGERIDEAMLVDSGRIVVPQN
ncbi:Phosphatase dcr2 [Ophidiomyces ophidiicola]|nr:Phosphatase dcr2 [Ophidiomyces ophidiicola]KAI1928690.1 Phosphatase dcr2 [Ophidiomyces ophidiicola]KAI1966207.1 Phosphatase dcr2 [Ophidiomyces ophidiicola]KAI1976326.1 Phosphatase dcr2 [Ophidiomyces ophidiicola]KAI2037306.1 Phosphatase dcr2 [Ophidiomyces ophidiicola]